LAAPSVSHATSRIKDLFAAGEWATTRSWIGRRADHNPFISSNILLILERCAAAAELAGEASAARSRLDAYREGHRYYHWPLTAGRSRLANAPLLGRLRLMELSPDADCTCLAHLARGDLTSAAEVAGDLACYRAQAPFRLPRFQEWLPAVAGSFLTWFPSRESCRPGKVETVDLGVDCNILWYLAAADRLATPGAAATAAFVAAAVRSGLLLNRPFVLSPYYPIPAVLLYLVTRAAVWGRVEALLALEGEVRALAGRCPAPSVLERLCLRAACAMWNGGDDGREGEVPLPDGRGAFYVAPLLAWPLQRWSALESLAAHPASQWRFGSEALEWALVLQLASGATS
jgi:hypothetical protein